MVNGIAKSELSTADHGAIQKLSAALSSATGRIRRGWWFRIRFGDFRYSACAVCPPPCRYFTVRSLSTFSYHTIKCNPTSQCRSTLHVLTNAYCPLSVDGGRIPVSLNQSTIKQRATRTVGALSLVSPSLSVSLTHDVTSRGPAAAFVGLRPSRLPGPARETGDAGLAVGGGRCCGRRFPRELPVVEQPWCFLLRQSPTDRTILLFRLFKDRCKLSCRGRQRR